MGNQSQSLDENNYQAPDPSYSANPEERAIQQDRIEMVRKIMDSLPEKQRSVMQLRETEGKSYKEIAAVMDISEEQVKVSIFRARQAIKQRYEQIERYGL
jgi:RNA polymerase sigma-70 factor (ECF subfamily)